jgi:hypothetical protein
MQQMSEAKLQKQAQRNQSFKKKDSKRVKSIFKIISILFTGLLRLLRFIYIKLFIAHIIFLMLNILTIMIVFLIPAVADIFLLWILTLSFGKALLAGVLVGQIFIKIKTFSAIIAFVSYILTLLTFLAMFAIDYFSIFSKTEEVKSKDFKAKLSAMGQVIALTLRDTIVLTAIFLVLTGVIILILTILIKIPLFILIFPSSYVDPVRFISAVTLALGYLITIIRALYNQLKDFYDKFFKKGDESKTGEEP